MSFDVSQFHQVFFEESFESLEHMESALLDLSQGSDDPELIHLIFRAAHSIKGGSGTFGFSAVADFTHVMETLLDEMREGTREITKDALNLLLETGDVLRDMLEAARDGKDFDVNRTADVQKRLESLLCHDGSNQNPQAQPEVERQADCWSVKFAPYDHLLKTGNDPLRIIRELASLGDLKVNVNTNEIPDIDKFDPEECYLAWNLELRGSVTKESILEIFEWVEDDCDLVVLNKEITPAAPNEDVASVNNTAPSTSSANVTPVVNTSNDRRSNDDRRGGEDRRKADRRTGATDSSIRVSIKKIDELINMVGELVITQSMLGQVGSELEEIDAVKSEKLRDGLAQLERNTRELQESVMQIRMLPISFSFNRFPRLVHDLSAKLGKKVELKISGENTELDKTVMEKIGDPLVHLVRNALDHGIETPEIRAEKGKPEHGTVHLNAYHQGGNIIIEISDDGAGLDANKLVEKAKKRGLLDPNEVLSNEKAFELIFMPGFSTVDEVSDLSGRGVGMDVVSKNIKDLAGTIELTSKPNEGTTFRIRLPLTLAILDGQLLTVGQEVFIMPMVSIVESLQLNAALVNTVGGDVEVYRLREDYVPIVRLYELFDLTPKTTELENSLLIVVEHEGQKIGLVVDELLGQQQVVIKSLETNFRKVECLSGATILGDGTVALILDVGGLINTNEQFPNIRRKPETEQAA